MDNHGQTHHPLIVLLRRDFPEGNHYILDVSDHGGPDRIFKNLIFGSSEGPFPQATPELGRRLGWIPDEPVMFFFETVEDEVACARAVVHGRPAASVEDRHRAREILHGLALDHLLERKPFFLSEGESKLIWFACQWIKSPEYCVFSRFSSALSPEMRRRLLDFLADNTVSDSRQDGTPCTLIFGVSEGEDIPLRPEGRGKWVRIRDSKTFFLRGGA